MRAHPNWSYAPYRPPFVEVGDPYICRIEPHSDRVTLDWLPSNGPYTVFARLRGEGDFVQAGCTPDCTFTLTGLAHGQTWEFYVENSAGSRSRCCCRCACRGISAAPAREVAV